MKTIDLHTHTNYSDGTATVEETLTQAQELGLTVLSVTDHNTVDAYDEIVQKRHLFKGILLPGVELTTIFENEVIEILGYGINTEKMKSLISESYLTFYEKQVREAAINVITLSKKGVTLSPDFVEAMCEHPETVFDPSRKSSRAYLLAEIKSYPENARFFASQDEFENITHGRFSREYLFNAGSALFCDQSSLFPTLDRVISMIRECGGLCFLAHPFIYSRNIVRSLDDVVARGPDGIECHYGTFTEDQKSFLVGYCDKNGLFKSGGSDHHGIDMRPQNLMGFSAGVNIPHRLIEPWLDRVEASMM